MLSFAVVGTGAVGGYYGALLQKAGREVHFLLRSGFEHVREHGLKIDSPRGGFVLPEVKVYRNAADMPRCDAVIVAWKTTENHNLKKVLPRLVKPGGTVVVLQNGLDPELDAARHAGQAQVVSGLCFLCSRQGGPGWIIHQDYGAITLAAFLPRPGVTPEIQALAEEFSAAGVETRLHDNWRAARWRKLVWNVPFNGLCALRGKDTRALLADPAERALVKQLMLEVLAGAAAEGCPLPADFADRMIADTDKMIPYEPSMKLDRDKGRPMELEAIYGRPLESMRSHGVAAPGMEALYGELKGFKP